MTLELETPQTAEVAQPVETPEADHVDPAAFYEDDQPKQADERQAEGDASQEGEEGEQQEGDAEPIAAPLSWAKDAKEVFGQLPREAQEIIAKREADREVAVQSKFREAAQTRQQVETEARTALQTIMGNHVQQLQQYAQQFEMPAPDPRLLYGDDSQRALYYQQDADYRNAAAQREQVTQQMQEAQQQAGLIAHHQQQAELQAEHEVLEEKLGTEWSDLTSRAKLLGDLTPIAAELGYPQELIGQARAVDIIAMKHVADLKAKADKYDALNKAKMVPVRAAKGAIPPTARTGAPQTGRQAADPIALMYPDDVRRN